jgi:hypothetical protein
MLSASRANEVIKKWIDAANKKDVEGVMQLYTIDPEVESPVIVDLMKEPSGRLRGKEKLRAYITKAFSLPAVSWHLIDSAWGVSSLSARYVNHKGTISITYMELDALGKIKRHVNHFIGQP